MIARPTTILETQKLVKIYWKPTYTYQSIVHKLQNAITQSVANQCEVMCKKSWVESSYQHLQLSLVVYILSIHAKRMKHKRFPDFIRILHYSTYDLKVTRNALSYRMTSTVRPRKGIMSITCVHIYSTRKYVQRKNCCYTTLKQHNTMHTKRLT